MITNAESSKTTLSNGRRRSVLALALLAPVPSLGVAAAMIFFPGAVGQALFLAAKLWLLALPAVWYLLIEGGAPSWSPPARGGLGIGLATGFGAGAMIVGAAFAVGVFENEMSDLAVKVGEIGLATPRAYLLGAVGWSLANSLMEEYVYRWFVFSQCERLMPRTAAVIASAVIFTAHHVIALSTYLPWHLNALASFGVFSGGVLWAVLYSRYRSIWPCWLSHVVADIAVFGVGWALLFS